MSAETLRRAANEIRLEAHPSRFELAVADWLDDFADIQDSIYVHPSQREAAVTVARAYLGETA